MAVLLLAVSIFGGYWFASDWLLWKGGQQLEESVKTESLTDPEQIWQKWTELSQGRASSFLLYGSRRAVNVLLASCAPHCTALAPPPALLVWLHAGVIIVESSLRHEGL